MSEGPGSVTSQRHQTGRHSSGQLPAVAIALLVLTAAMSLIVSHYYLANGDDLLELWGDRVSGFVRLIQIQRTSPLEIDPLFYHALTWAEIALVGVKPFLLRLPSLAGFVMTQVSLFVFVRRVAGKHTALLAMVLPAITAAFEFTWIIRPYALLLGLFAVAAVSWQTATRRTMRRASALVLLAISIALAINTHYYAVLLLVPLGAAEVVRLWQNRRFDVPMLLSVLLGTSAVVFVLPFLRGAADFRSHYVSEGVPYNVIPQSYNSILLGRAVFSVSANHQLAAALALVSIAVLWSCIRQRQTDAIDLPAAEFTLLLTLAALPVFAFLIGHLATHAFEPRYALGAVIGISALAAISLSPVLHGRTPAVVVLSMAVGLFCWKNVREVRILISTRQNELASLRLAPQVRAAIEASPGKLLYIQDIDVFLFAEFHETDPEVLSHLALVYSEQQELRWNHIETSTRLILHLKSIAPFTILPYEAVISQPGVHAFVVDEGGWNWIRNALAAQRLETQPVGTAFGMQVVAVRALPEAAAAGSPR